MTTLFGPDEDTDPLTNRECPCPDPDDQYLMQIDAGTVYLTHKACGKQPRAWLDDAFGTDQIPVTLHWHYDGPVPALPMGPFTPTVDDMLGVWEGVPLTTIGEDGEDLILLTDDRDKAVAAAMAYDNEVGVHPDSANYDNIRAFWAVFEWEPEDAPCPWTVRWDAAEGDEHAVRIHYLPA